MEGGTGWGQVLGQQVPAFPYALGPQFIHLGQREGLESADLGGPSHSDVLNLKNRTGPRCGGGGWPGRKVAMATGAQGSPGLSGLASCPEAALVTLDTGARRRGRGPGGYTPERPAAGVIGGS